MADGGIDHVFIPKLPIFSSGAHLALDVLLRAGEHDGYPTRLFVERQIDGKVRTGSNTDPRPHLVGAVVELHRPPTCRSCRSWQTISRHFDEGRLSHKAQVLERIRADLRRPQRLRSMNASASSPRRRALFQPTASRSLPSIIIRSTIATISTIHGSRMVGSAAISKALEIAYGSKASMFHVHLHEHLGTPRFSPTDTRESAKFVPDFFKVAPGMPHGAIVWSPRPSNRPLLAANDAAARPDLRRGRDRRARVVPLVEKMRDFSRQSFSDLTAMRSSPRSSSAS